MHHKVQEQEDDVIHMSAIRTKFLNDHVHNLNYLHIKPLNSSSSNIYSLSLSHPLHHDHLETSKLSIWWGHLKGWVLKCEENILPDLLLTQLSFTQ